MKGMPLKEVYVLQLDYQVSTLSRLAFEAS